MHGGKKRRVGLTNFDPRLGIEVRVLSSRQVPGSSIRIHMSQFLAIFKLDIKKFTLPAYSPMGFFLLENL